MLHIYTRSICIYFLEYMNQKNKYSENEERNISEAQSLNFWTRTWAIFLIIFHALSSFFYYPYSALLDTWSAPKSDRFLRRLISRLVVELHSIVHFYLNAFEDMNSRYVEFLHFLFLPEC